MQKTQWGRAGGTVSKVVICKENAVLDKLDKNRAEKLYEPENFENWKGFQLKFSTYYVIFKL